MKRFQWILFGFLLFFCLTSHAFAASTYVLPYPSLMPGSSLYKFYVLYEKISQYWYFGDFGQFTYNLKEADMYLVQAKTLFEYQQYLLGLQALARSDFYFQNIQPNIVAAKKHGKPVAEKEALLKSAAEKHIETLQFIKSLVPKTVLWSPEKSAATALDLSAALERAISMRKNYL